jgi:hypothetical protein
LKRSVFHFNTVIVDDEKAQRSVLRRKTEEIFGNRIQIVDEAFSVESAIGVCKNFCVNARKKC